MNPVPVSTLGFHTEDYDPWVSRHATRGTVRTVRFRNPIPSNPRKSLYESRDLPFGPFYRSHTVPTSPTLLTRCRRGTRESHRSSGRGTLPVWEGPDSRTLVPPDTVAPTHCDGPDDSCLRSGREGRGGLRLPTRVRDV